MTRRGRRPASARDLVGSAHDPALAPRRRACRRRARSPGRHARDHLVRRRGDDRAARRRRPRHRGRSDRELAGLHARRRTDPGAHLGGASRRHRVAGRAAGRYDRARLEGPGEGCHGPGDRRCRSRRPPRAGAHDHRHDARRTRRRLGCGGPCEDGLPDHVRRTRAHHGRHPASGRAGAGERGVRTSDVSWPIVAGPLVLRPPTSVDLDQVLVWRNRPEVTRWLLRTTVDPDAFRRAWLLAVEDPNDFSVVADLDGVIVGTGSLEVLDGMGQTDGDAWRRAEGSLGYLVDPAFAGRGYATTIARALLDLAFTTLGLHRVTAGCFADNTPSWRVMENVGMRREQHGVRDSWHAELGWIDGYTYAVLAEEWTTTR
ncbi:GNAT family N-acetyltransferase [Agromyces intestinalis]|uniref:GNAT family N-acetyltransferase n=1 Tax=Agromyces intestinalis TaxID=2592652 RepID=A0A5C1YIC8_9MICO|nr:GNAT family N-acetyltransferase [Agromyces intestinalis]